MMQVLKVTHIGSVITTATAVGQWSTVKAAQKGVWSTVKARSEIRSTLTMAGHSAEWMNSYARTTVCRLSLERFCIDSDRAANF